MNLTEEQKNSLWTSQGIPTRDHRIISARPGTGKTSTLADYCCDVLTSWDNNFTRWQGIALLSYTNVAKGELGGRLESNELGSAMFSYPHFCGTIDSFINQYIFLPYGSQVMGSSKRPKLVGEPHAPWEPFSGRQLDRYFESVDYHIDDALHFEAGALAQKYGRRKITIESQRIHIIAAKRSLNKRHFATQNDSNYFAYRVLCDFPRIAQALVCRFPSIIIDEAQDMTEIQHAIFDKLIQTGLQHVVLIGDECQAIYEWNTARPELFVEKMNSNAWQTKTISESFRCSSNICNALNSLVAENPEQQLSPYTNSKNITYTDPVRIVNFNSKDADARNRLIQIINELSASLAVKTPHSATSNAINIAILARSKDETTLLRSLYSGETQTRYEPINFSDTRTRHFLSIIHLCLEHNFSKALTVYEKVLYSSEDYLDHKNMREHLGEAWFGTLWTELDYRKKILSTLQNIRAAIEPISEQRSVLISDCLGICELDLPGLESALPKFKEDLEKYKPRARTTPPNPPLSILFMHTDRESFQVIGPHENVNLTFSTIHGVKGETYDGVLFVIKNKTTSCGCPSSSNRNLKIAQHDILCCESKRIQYVAASRAAQSLWIAVQDSEAAWSNVFHA